MKQRELYIRFGAGVVVMALLFLLLQTGMPLLIWLETGRRPGAAPEGTAPAPETVTSAPLPTGTAPSDSALPVFSPEDLQYVTVLNSSRRDPVLELLLTQPLSWQLAGPEPTVLILHSHATESYEGTPGWRSLNPEENMVSIGAEVARVLEAGGIRVIHDRTLYDDPSYADAYSNARQAIRQWLSDYPTIRLVLDIHRDASAGTQGQLITSATVGGQRSAQLMLVLGTDQRSAHPAWQENLALGLKLATLLEQYNPGICRPIQLRSQRFNMDLCPGSLLVEVGAAGNTHQEALIAANALAQAILALSRGTG